MAGRPRKILTPNGARQWILCGVAHGLILGLMACSPPPRSGWSGYAEGEYVYISSPIGGQLRQLLVKPGDQIQAGSELFRLDDASELAAEEQAGAQWEAARAQAENAQKGRRPDEIDIIRSQLAQARSQAALAQKELERRQSLTPGGAVSASELDTARAALTQAMARERELESSLHAAELPARADEQLAARAQAQAASAALRQSAWKRDQKLQRAPTGALVADTFFRTGEYVNAGQPVVSLLPPGHIKARFFVPEAERADLKLGDVVWLSCDGCEGPVKANVDRIATQPEYTPPVIYSNEQRAKLVFMYEAKPSPEDSARFKPGQPLDVQKDPKK